ncbi:kinesin-like protein KIN-4C isoform X2 [Triticum dicoccoides]|uniref:kinesin-like protein KIN-4C isoform X2 n=1 Tax=Triticum dicoccoides TaxID=85692 RepID=UPI00188F9CFA|nr:kinesin-like protein KIN-4C isoform X2 [Triticum dicoccoides]
MGSSDMASRPQSDSVKVAVNVRPLITPELVLGCTDCVTVTPGEPQVQIGPHIFTYDHVYGSTGSSSSLIFEQCVYPLVDSLFCGYNTTVLAYGQTGSGKTYTMGTNYSGESNCGGIIPQVMETIFKKADAMKGDTEFLIRVSFIEIFKEEVFDLLDDPGSVAKAAAPARVPIQIRETANGSITLAGVTEAEVKSKEEMALHLARGSLSRATGSTNMNSQSSRSHAIFTISIEQKRTSSSASEKSTSNEYDILSSKFHLVDLAGSERAKRTGADGLRLKEGIHINRGLLALGNVISALGDEKKRKEGAFVPYRDSKLTRLLQDSLGGNSKTVMIACISPADSNAEETINTLKYANRARNIQNKAVINRDPVTAEMQKLRSQLEQLQSELLFSRSGSAALEELQLLQQKVSLLELKNSELYCELKEREMSCEQLAQRAVAAQLEKDQLMLKLESARNGKSWDDIENAGSEQDVDLMKTYLSKIQQLEAEVTRQKFSTACRNGLHDRLALDKGMLLDDLGSGCEVGTLEVSSEVDEEEKEREHSSIQEKLDMELQDLDKRLQQKEAEMKQFAKSDTSVLKQHYETKLHEMEQEKKAFQKEIEDLRHALAKISSSTDECSHKMKENYLQKMNMLETQVSQLKKKQDAHQQLLRQKQKSDDAAMRLQGEIQRIKSQKVQLQQKIKQESEQFRSWKAAREKEVLQLKKEGRRNEYEMHKLLALNQKQKMVLQRKTEEATMATKRLKDLLEAKKSTRDAHGASGIQALMRTIDDELEVTVRAYELRSHYDRQIQERATISKEIAKLKECPEAMSPSARSSRISALENMLSSSSSAMVSMASQLSEAEERERVFSGRGRWNHVRSLPDAKNTMNYLFQLASSSRCQLHDKEVMCIEKDLIIGELKEKVVALNGRTRQLEAQVNDLHNQNMQLFAAMNNAKKSGRASRRDTTIDPEDGQIYALRKSARGSQFKHGKNSFYWSDDMDISDAEESGELEDMSDDGSDTDWVESSRKINNTRRRTSNPSRNNSLTDVKSEMPSQEIPTIQKEHASSQCCSCSSKSLCKLTRYCECRALGSQCGTGCGCNASKCSNRVRVVKEEIDDEPPSEKEGSEFGNVSSSENDAKMKEEVKQGIMLLENAVAEKETQQPKSRKPLADIGNTDGKQGGAKPKQQRKNWRKSATIQLVPTEPPPPASASAPDNAEAAPQNRADIPLRLPRAMSSASAAESNPLTDRNASKAGETVSSNKENGSVATRAPAPAPARSRKNAAMEKENHLG